MDPASNPAEKKRFNPNYIGLILLVVAYIISLMDVLRPQVTSEGEAIDPGNIVRVLHWQLEPGFREALDVVIEEYNALPHVREAGYAVQQMAVTERVYSQFLNVHLISGTAPDLATLGKSTMANNRAQFFEPFLDVLERPNPYNAEPYLPDDLDPQLRRFLINTPWKETFLDGLQSTLEPNLGYYFAIPVASWGTVRFYYNRDMLAAVKQLIRDGFAQPQLPGWMAAVLDDQPNTTPGAFLPDTPQLREWVAADSAPKTFGQLVLLCEACREYARLIGNDKLVPISGSSYSRDLFMDVYNSSFFYAWEDRLDFDRSSSFENLEVFAGYDQGLWDFQEPRLRAYYDLQMKLATYFPPGFLGLDREQANRRFILGNALLLATGAWDAAGIFIGAESRLDPEDRFEVGVIPFPLPAAGERWGQFDPKPRSEGGGGGGVPLALYKFSQHKEEAVDFLHYLTSYAGNSKFVSLAGWLPSVVGIDPVDEMKPFLPIIRGVPGQAKLAMIGGNVETIYNGQYYLLISGDISYETFVERVTAALEDERNGTLRQWYEQFRRSRENTRGIERSLTLQRFHQLIGNGLDQDVERYRQVLHRSSNGLGGLSTQRDWIRYGYDQPFPEF
jgi:raffinose/stachyose/melibiose transport system substrate-binding protein